MTSGSGSLSVVIPVRNGSSLLPVLFDALDGQTDPVDRVIVVDDGSTDDTRTISEHRGMTVVDSPGSGPYAARNTGWRSVGTELVAFVDARSRPLPRWAAGVRRVMEDPSYALATTGTEVVGGTSLAERAAVHEQIFGLGSYVDTPWYLPYFATCNLTVRRSVLEAVGGFDPSRSGGDADLCFRVQLDGLGSLGVDRRVLMTWQAREGLRSSFEQWSRYGRSNADLRARYADRGAQPLPFEPPARVVARAVRAAAALAVRRNRPDDPAAVRNVVTLWYSLYGLGRWSAEHPVGRLIRRSR